MKTKRTSKSVQSYGLIFLCLSVTISALGQTPSPAERAAILKATLAASQVVLRQYQWVQTTVISVNDQEKSRSQEQCYYGADGGLQKVSMSNTPPPEKRRGLRGRIAEHRQQELTDYMRRAVGLVKTYVPPDPVKIQAAKQGGRVSIEILEPGKRARLNFRDYEKPGDNLGVEIELSSNRPLGVKVSTYLDDPQEIVSLDVQMGQLNEGTTYPSNIMLEAKAKKLRVTVQNSGYRRM